MRPLGPPNPRAANHNRPSRPVCLLLASFGELECRRQSPHTKKRNANETHSRILTLFLCLPLSAVITCAQQADERLPKLKATIERLTKLRQTTTQEYKDASKELAELWHTDWDAFSHKVDQISGVSGIDLLAVRVFTDEDVKWTGVVKEIKLPTSDPKSAHVVIDMTPLSIMAPNPGGPSSAATLNAVFLTPTTEEWRGWSDAKTGQRVTFRTKLVNDGPTGVFTFLAYRKRDGDNAIMALINTKGGDFVKSHSSPNDSKLKDNK
ncbi:MAG: hypothetical protein NTY01_18875 [Verrucomicrobia bacterium]|nr:hypothetical protein [Verrucomicrobiota bacterium]